jgi:carboxylesterase type B
VGVAIQYRLGAFGFLSSDEVYRNGVPNAGIYDQRFALQWVQDYIHLFGGNASQVTISGESAGMLALVNFEYHQILIVKFPP